MTHPVFSLGRCPVVQSAEMKLKITVWAFHVIPRESILTVAPVEAEAEGSRADSLLKEEAVIGNVTCGDSNNITSFFYLVALLTISKLKNELSLSTVQTTSTSSVFMIRCKNCFMMYEGVFLFVSAVKLTEEVDVEADVFYPITCGDAKATLVWKKFVCPGINVKCVQVCTPSFLKQRVEGDVNHQQLVTVQCLFSLISSMSSSSARRSLYV